MTVTASQLRLLIDVPLDKVDADLQPFLDVASLIRSEDLAGSGLSMGRLDQIELYLAAHFATISLENGGVLAQKQGQSSDTYKTIDGKLTGLQSTRFGQQVLALDTSNILQSTMSTKKATFQVVRSVQSPNLNWLGYGYFGYGVSWW